MPTKKPKGRKSLPSGGSRKAGRKNKGILIRVTAAQKQVLAEAAKSVGLGLSSWMLSGALQTVQKMQSTASYNSSVTTQHLAYVEVDLESIDRGGSTRIAACLCGWKGPQRATLELAADDALTHGR